MSSSRREDLWRRINADSAPMGSLPSPRPESPRFESPWPGTLWVHPATAAFAVEWLVVAWGPKQPQTCLLVPADSRPILGATDVAIGSQELGGPLSIRCHLGQWVPPSILEHAQASGRVAESNLALIRDRHLQSTREDSRDPLLGSDGGPSPSYEDWIDELGQAWLALRASLPEAQDPTPRASPPWLAACAVVVITLGAGSAWYLGRQDLINLDPGSLDSIVEKVGAGGPSPSNFARIVMSTATTRGISSIDELLLPAEAEHVMIFIVLDGDAHFQEYRLRLIDLGSGRQVWSVDDLRPIDDGVGVGLSTLIPKRILHVDSDFPADAPDDSARPTLHPGFRVFLEGRDQGSSPWTSVTQQIVRPRVPPASEP